MKTTLKMFMLLLLTMVHVHVNAQWNADTDTNTLVVNSEGLDTQAISSTNGKTYVVFWESDAPPTNFELRLQILDIDGTQLLGENGMLVSNSIPMSTYTVIWNITTDNNGNLYIGVTGTGGEEAYVFKLDNEGNHLWDENGVQVGTGYSVTILPLDNGEAVVSWFPGGESVFQKYDANGNAIWGAPKTISNSGNDTVPASLFEVSNNEFVILFHSITYAINSEIYAQKYNADGDSLWNVPTKLSDYTLQWNIPYYGMQIGDVVYFGYKAAHDNRFDSYLQRINPDGSLPWGINGADFDTNQTDFEMGTKIAHQEGSQYIWAVCTYTDVNQSGYGEFVQKFDKDSGARMFTETAKEIYPIGSEKVHAGTAIYLVDDMPILLIKDGYDNGASPTTLHALSLDENGDFAWAEETRPIATFGANKGNISFTKAINNQHVAVFVEDKGTGPKIYAQNFLNGELSTNDSALDNSIYFDNPVTNQWSILSSKTINNVEIYNVLGQTIFSIENKVTNQIQINTENWNTGVYIIRVSTEEGTLSKQVLKR